MAGGKETPRQKMIGMMYLVLTALLALNVSKSILDAFVAIEENIQVASENEFARGMEKKNQLHEQATSSDEPSIRAFAALQFKTVEEIDRKTANFIREVDEIKLEILKACGENTTTGKDQIILAPYSKSDPLKPTRMNLEKVEGKDKYDEPMYILIGESIKNPTGKGMKIWSDYNNYRSGITELIASSASAEGKNYAFKAPKINAFSSYQELSKKVQQAIASSQVHPDDHDIILKIYTALTKKERSIVNEVKDVHWVGKTFDHAPSVAALASLSALQKEVLTARADAIAHLRGRIGGGEFSFNKIMPLAYGPELVNSGDEVSLQVLMAAYDSHTNPTLALQNGTLHNVSNGIATVKLKPAGIGETVVRGIISIKNKRGETKSMPWEKTIRVMKPTGTVRLLDMNRLYRGHENPIEAVASGFEETILKGNGVNLTKKGNGWIAEPTGGNSCSITVFGRDKATNRQVSLGTFIYKVSNMPTPDLFWGNTPNGGDVNYFGNGIFSKYGPTEPLNAEYNVLGLEITASSIGRTLIVNGGAIPADIQQMLKSVKKGDIIQVVARVKPKKGNGPIVRAVGSWKRI